MFQLTRRVDYGLVALAHMARSADSLTSVRELSELYGLPSTLLAQILRVLARGGVLDAVRGSKGGYKLRRTPDEIRLSEIVGILEMPVQIVVCAGRREQCDIQGHCIIRPTIQILQRKIERVLEETTLSEIAGIGDYAESPRAERA